MSLDLEIPISRDYLSISYIIEETSKLLYLLSDFSDSEDIICFKVKNGKKTTISKDYIIKCGDEFYIQQEGGDNLVVLNFWDYGDEKTWAGISVYQPNKYKMFLAICIAIILAKHYHSYIYDERQAWGNKRIISSDDIFTDFEKKLSGYND